MIPSGDLGKTCLLLLGLFGLFSQPSRAQLADTIWEGTQWISSINLVSLKPDGANSFPSLLGARINLPLEIWFWDNTNFGIVFRNDRWGFVGRRKGEYQGYNYKNPGADYGAYTYDLKRGKFWRRDITSTDDFLGLDVYSGRITLKGQTLITDRITYSAADWLNGARTLGGVPVKRVGHPPAFDKTVWTYTKRQPSIPRMSRVT